MTEWRPVPDYVGIYEVSDASDIRRIAPARGATVGQTLRPLPMQNGYLSVALAEVTRLCSDGTRNVCSLLYAAAWRAARAMGYRKLITYTLATEPGTSLRAAGWRQVASVTPRSWNTPTRPRVDLYPLQAKFRWEVSA